MLFCDFYKKGQCMAAKLFYLQSLDPRGEIPYFKSWPSTEKHNQRKDELDICPQDMDAPA